MKRLILLLLLFGSIGPFFAQSSQISCSAYKEIYRFSGEWGQWPSHWTYYKSEGRTNPIIRVTSVKNGQYYRLQMFFDGKIEADFYVAYDSKISAQKRKDWDNTEVYCYNDVEGNYVYVENTSLYELSRSSASWVDKTNSILYMWIFSEDMAVAVK